VAAASFAAYALIAGSSIQRRAVHPEQAVLRTLSFRVGLLSGSQW